MKFVQKFFFTTFELKSIHFLISHEFRKKKYNTVSDESEFDDKYLCASSYNKKKVLRG